MAKTTLTSETTCEFGGPQDNPQVSRFVEELTELSTSILLMLWFKIAKGLKSAREVMCRAGLRRVPRPLYLIYDNTQLAGHSQCPCRQAHSQAGQKHGQRPAVLSLSTEA